MPGFEVIGDEEVEEVLDVFRNGGVLFRHGFDALRNGSYKVRDFEKAFADFLGVEKCLAVSSGTAALRVALASLGIGRGDEVITQAFTFVATAEAIIESGAQPVICEVDEGLNMNPKQLERLISKRTRAVIVVHMLGMPAHLKEISLICEAKGVHLIEDTAWGCGGSYLGRPLGTWGSVGTFSFDHAKAITTGEGGMLCFRDGETHEKAVAWHDHGHENNPRLPRWEDSRSSSGFNYRMSELQAAVGLAQLKKIHQIIDAHRNSYRKIREALGGLNWIQERPSPEGGEGTADAFVFTTETKEQAKNCREELLADGLATKILPEATSWHFAGQWNHMKELVEYHGSLEESFPISCELLSRSVALPVTVTMPDDLPGRIRKALRRVDAR